MFKVNDYLIYKRDVCKVLEIKPNYINNKDYYTISPISDESLMIKIPTDNLHIRNLLSKQEVENFIKKIPDIDIIEANNRLIENQYKELLHSEDHEALIKIIKTTYLRNEERHNNNKRIGDTDDRYFKLAEKYLYNEFSIVLGMEYEETKKHVIDIVNNL